MLHRAGARASLQPRGDRGGSFTSWRRPSTHTICTWPCTEELVAAVDVLLEGHAVLALQARRRPHLQRVAEHRAFAEGELALVHDEAERLLAVEPHEPSTPSRCSRARSKYFR